MNKKIEELLAILDLPEDQQKLHLIADGILSTAEDEIGAAYLTESLAKTAFRLRNECHDPFGWCAWDRACWEVWKYYHKQQNSNIFERTHLSLETREKYCFNWMLFWADPIHWIITALITKEIATNPEEKFDAHLVEKEVVKTSIHNILATPKGARVELPNFNEKVREVYGIAQEDGKCETCNGSGIKPFVKFYKCNTCEKSVSEDHLITLSRDKSKDRCPTCKNKVVEKTTCPNCSNKKDRICKRCGGVNGHKQVDDPMAGDSHMLTKMQCPFDDHKRTLAYGIAQDDGKGCFGFWKGPNPSLEAMLIVDGRDNKSVLWRFNEDGTDEIIYRWACGEWMKVIGEYREDG